MNKPQTQAPAVAHTPTPWRMINELYVASKEGRDLATITIDHSRSETRGNAAFIVRAVNSHAALVSACESADKAMSGVHSWQDEQIARQLIKFALALAHGTKEVQS